MWQINLLYTIGYNMKLVNLSVFFSIISVMAQASVSPEYAHNVYSEHTLSRAEKKCIDEGYKITYANCDNQTAPSDRCPHHDGYYRSCSQEQWCRNNNYTFLEKDCILPTYPVKICDNQFAIYRSCQRDTAKACTDLGYTSADECSLSDEHCEYDDNYGKCCDDCPDYPYEIDKVPSGYVSSNETCTTCDGITKTKVVEANCDGFTSCQYGPISPQTPLCRKGEKTLYSACKTAENLCQEKGYLHNTCQNVEDEFPCEEFNGLKKCKINCYKYAVFNYSESDIIAQDVTNPDINPEKKSLTSLYGEISPECIGKDIPLVTLNLNKDNFPIYRELFNRNISNVNFHINFEEPLSLEANGSLNNVRIAVDGTPDKCAFSGKNIIIEGKVSISGNANICSDIEIKEMSKFTSSGDINGNVNTASNVTFGLKGNLNGSLKTKAYSEVFIKGAIDYTNKQSNSPEMDGITFGCNTHAKIAGGITLKAANMLLRQYALIDTPSIKLISTGTSDSGAASIHMYKHSKITSILGDSEYLLSENEEEIVIPSCDDRQMVHKVSSIGDQSPDIILMPGNLLENKWQCSQLSRLQLKCN